MANRHRYCKEDVPLLLDDQFSLLKKCRRKIEQSKIKYSNKDSKKIQKYFDYYLRKLDDVSIYLVELASLSKEIERAIISDLNKRIERNKRSSANIRVINVLQVLLADIKTNRQFQ